jgi:hypothetical protein
MVAHLDALDAEKIRVGHSAIHGTKDRPVVIGGLVSSTILTLVRLPVVDGWIEGRHAASSPPLLGHA